MMNQLYKKFIVAGLTFFACTPSYAGDITNKIEHSFYIQPGFANGEIPLSQQYADTYLGKVRIANSARFAFTAGYNAGLRVYNKLNLDAGLSFSSMGFNHTLADDNLMDNAELVNIKGFKNVYTMSAISLPIGFSYTLFTTHNVGIVAGAKALLSYTLRANNESSMTMYNSTIPIVKKADQAQYVNRFDVGYCFNIGVLYPYNERMAFMLTPEFGLREIEWKSTRTPFMKIHYFGIKLGILFASTH